MVLYNFDHAILFRDAWFYEIQFILMYGFFEIGILYSMVNWSSSSSFPEILLKCMKFWIFLELPLESTLLISQLQVLYYNVIFGTQFLVM